MKKLSYTCTAELKRKFFINHLMVVFLFSTTTSLLGVMAIKINTKLLSLIANKNDYIDIIKLSFIAIIFQLILFVIQYMNYITTKRITLTNMNIYTNYLMESLFKGKTNLIYSFNKSDIVYYSTEVVSDSILEKYDIVNQLLGTILGMIIYVFSFQGELPLQYIIIIGFIYYVVYGLTSHMSKKISILADKLISINSNINVITNEFLDNAEDVRLMGIQDSVYKIVQKHFESLKTHNKRLNFYHLLLSCMSELPGIFIIVVTFMYIYSRIMEGSPIELYFIIIPVSFTFINYFTSLIGLRTKVQKERNLDKTISSFAEIEREDSMTFENDIKIVQVKTTELQYTYDKKNIMKYPSYNFTLPSFIFIQGESGCGKTTFLRILTGLLAPIKGETIFYTKKDEKKSPVQCKNSIGYHPQRCFLYHNTIRENIILGEKFSDHEVHNALKMANAFDFVISKPKGLDTIIGIAGQGLSGGEKQRITLARILIRQPNILILDESFSALDNKNCAEVYSHIKEKKILSFLVSHRDDFSVNTEDLVTIILHSKE